MTTYLPTARPVWSVVCWVDDVAVYVELPVKNGPPYVTKYELSDGGLSKALNVMRKAHTDARGGRYKADKDHPLIKRPNLSKDNAAATDTQRANAAAVLKRLKIT